MHKIYLRIRHKWMKLCWRFLGNASNFVDTWLKIFLGYDPGLAAPYLFGEKQALTSDDFEFSWRWTRSQRKKIRPMNRQKVLASMQRFIYDRLRTLHKKMTDTTGETKKEYLQYSSLYSSGYIEAYGSWFFKKVCVSGGCVQEY